LSLEWNSEWWWWWWWW